MNNFSSYTSVISNAHFYEPYLLSNYNLPIIAYYKKETCPKPNYFLSNSSCVNVLIFN